MSSAINRRVLLKESLGATAAGALALHTSAASVSAAAEPEKPTVAAATKALDGSLPLGQIGKLKLSRMLLGGNLLTHYFDCIRSLSAATQFSV